MKVLKNIEVDEELKEDSLSEGLQSLSESIVQSVSGAVSKLLEGESKKQYFDKELGKIIKAGLEKLTLDLRPKEVDMSGVLRIAETIASQNKMIIQLLSRPQSDSSEKLITEMIAQNAKILSGLQPTTVEKAKEWEFEITERDKYGGGIKKITAKSK